LDALGEGFEVADTLNFVVGKFDAEMIFETREHFESLEAVDAEFLVKIVVGHEGARRDFELLGGEFEDLLRGLFDGAHTHSIYHSLGGKENVEEKRRADFDPEGTEETQRALRREEG
jgi:hypothetical protein